MLENQEVKEFTENCCVSYDGMKFQKHLNHLLSHFRSLSQIIQGKSLIEYPDILISAFSLGFPKNFSVSFADLANAFLSSVLRNIIVKPREILILFEILIKRYFPLFKSKTIALLINGNKTIQSITLNLATDIFQFYNEFRFFTWNYIDIFQKYGINTFVSTLGIDSILYADKSIGNIYNSIEHFHLKIQRGELTNSIVGKSSLLYKKALIQIKKEKSLILNEFKEVEKEFYSKLFENNLKKCLEKEIELAKQSEFDENFPLLDHHSCSSQEEIFIDEEMSLQSHIKQEDSLEYNNINAIEHQDVIINQNIEVLNYEINNDELNPIQFVCFLDEDIIKKSIEKKEHESFQEEEKIEKQNHGKDEKGISKKENGFIINSEGREDIQSTRTISKESTENFSQMQIENSEQMNEINSDTNKENYDKEVNSKTKNQAYSENLRNKKKEKRNKKPNNL